MSIIIELVEKYIVISGDSYLDTVLFAIIAFLSFAIAFGLVGSIFDFFGFYDSDVMSDTHWIIRVIIFGTLTWILVQVFKFIKWLFSFQWWVYLILVFVTVIIVILTYIIKYRVTKRLNQNHKNAAEAVKEVPKLIVEEQKQQKTEKEYDKYLCPRCNKLLVERKGPYGKFIGCLSYPKCNYTRKRF